MQLFRPSHVASVSRRLVPVTVCAVAGLLAACLLWPSAAEAKQPLGRNWPADRQVSMDRIDHSGFDALLQKYVDADGYVNYSAWQASSGDRRALQSYLSQLSRASLRKGAAKNSQLAFWINAYNAVTIEGILAEYPTDSIRNHTSKLGYNIWQDLPLLVGGRKFSLEEIEHQVLRPMGEPRIHFAIVCASVGCPRLRHEAYTADGLEEQLSDNSRDFFSRRGNLKVDAARRTLHLSAILKWFGKDFGPTDAARLTYLKPYLPAAAQRVAAGGASIRYLEYDWSLNDQSRKPGSAARR